MLGDRWQVWTIASDGGTLAQVTDYPHPGWVTTPLWSPDNTRVVATRGTSRMLIFDPRLPTARQKMEELPDFSDGGFAGASWSPDGTRIAGNTRRFGGGIVIYTVASGTYDELTKSGSSPRWLPDGRRLLYIDAGGLSLLDLTTRASQGLYSSPGETLSGPDVAPDAREIYVRISKPQSDIVLVKLTGGKP